ncbi:MAG: hypothetical protein C5B51_22565 [Terriglobia bacterium]|nr:MAG: hypothetical protein C5B51_22565 [Terriglobia bacterium]
MSLMQASKAAIAWDPKKRHWRVTIAVGAEVIRRSPEKPIPQDAADEVLRTAAAETARAEGYELSPADVSIDRPVA